MMDQYWWRFRERRIRHYERLGNFSVEPWGEKYYAVYDGDELVCVTVYKKGALEVMRRLWKRGNDQLNRQAQSNFLKMGKLLVREV